MTRATPLLELLEDLRVDPGERAAFTQDPDGYLAARGWADLEPDDLRDAVGFAREAAPLAVAMTMPDLAADDVTVTELVEHYVTAVAVDDLDDFGSDAAPIELDDVAPIVEVDVDIDIDVHESDEPVVELAHMDVGDLDDDDEDDLLDL